VYCTLHVFGDVGVGDGVGLGPEVGAPEALALAVGLGLGVGEGVAWPNGGRSRMLRWNRSVNSVFAPLLFKVRFANWLGTTICCVPTFVVLPGVR
jgi:hypothetical protein